MITIERLEPQQSDQVFELMHLWYPQVKHNRAYLAELLKDSDHFIVTIRKDDKLIGGGTAYRLKMFSRPTDEMFIYEIGIEEPFRGNGYGKKLMKYFLELAESEGCREVFIITEPSNLQANRLYKSIGFNGEHAVCYTHAIK